MLVNENLSVTNKCLRLSKAFVFELSPIIFYIDLATTQPIRCTTFILFVIHNSYIIKGQDLHEIR